MRKVYEPKFVIQEDYFGTVTYLPIVIAAREAAGADGDPKSVQRDLLDGDVVRARGYAYYLAA